MANRRLPPEPYEVEQEPALAQALGLVSRTCINCKLCGKECAFLRKYGKPKEIADSYDPANLAHRIMPFECSLCRLCESVCPVNVHPTDMFLLLRREDIARNLEVTRSKHNLLLGYEKRGASRRYSYYALPAKCDTVLFPGCALPGARPQTTLRLFEHLRKHIPNLGIVLDCCTKPSHDLGRQCYFEAMFGEMKNFLTDHGVRKVLVACPSCYRTFSDYGAPLEAQTVYELIADSRLPNKNRTSGVVRIHDPCAIRYDSNIHEATRQLVVAKGLTIEQMPHQKDKTICCGEGGAVGFVVPALAKQWSTLRAREARGSRIITYCAGCINFLGSSTPTSHLLDLLFDLEATMSGSVKPSKAPITYLNRIRLKNHLKRSIAAKVSRERTFSAEETGPKFTFFKYLLGSIRKT